MRSRKATYGHVIGNIDRILHEQDRMDIFLYIHSLGLSRRQEGAGNKVDVDVRAGMIR